MSDEKESAESRKVNILVACTGSVASVKIPILVKKLKTLKCEPEIRVVTTEHALTFYSPDELPDDVTLHRDREEWDSWTKVSDPVLHIELRRWADIMLIAPLDANTLAKMATGICDNLLTCIVRAWDMQRPLLFAPAMNTFMWEHPLTAQQIDKLKGFGYKLIPVIEKKLACGDFGFGAMAEVDTLVTAVEEATKQAMASTVKS